MCRTESSDCAYERFKKCETKKCNGTTVKTWVQQEIFLKSLSTHIVTGTIMLKIACQVPEVDVGLDTEPIRCPAHEAPALPTPCVP